MQLHAHVWGELTDLAILYCYMCLYMLTEAMNSLLVLKAKQSYDIRFSITNA